MSISPVVRRAERFQDLLAIPGGDGPYRFTRMFRESTWRDRWLSRRKFRLLKRIDGAIRATVRADEQVLFITSCRGLSFWERWVVGWRRALVVTNRRLILLQLDGRRRPRPPRSQIDVLALRRVRRGRWGRLELQLRSQRELLLRGIPGADRDVLLDLLGRAGRFGGTAEGPSEIEHLCPHCHHPVDGRPRRCPECSRPLAGAWRAALLSLLVPGAGGFQLGHRSFAVLEMLLAGSLWLAYLVGAEVWGVPALRTTVGPEWIALAVHGPFALGAWRVGRQALYPAGGNS